MVVDIKTWVKNVVNQPPSVTTNNIIVPLSTPTMSAKAVMITTRTNSHPFQEHTVMIDQLSTPTMCAKAVLICRPNSHPFQERTLLLDQPVKVGRSVARARATASNAIFDCKVLSRHHALLWYENGKFYLQDTKSSNGTFVNNNRLSVGGVESVPHEVCSGDIVQFGVDVVENNRKVTHGCIVATLKLYLHDGKEAKASHSLSMGSSVGFVPLDEMYKLNQYLQDALQREQLLVSKLNTLYMLVEQAREATNLSWQAFIGEDRLLSRVEILESQLLSYSKNYSEDKMREELLKLQEDKNTYQNSAKESLRKLHQERLDAISKLTELQQTLTTTEEEMKVCKEQSSKAQEDLQELAEKYSTIQQHESDLTNQLQAAEEQVRESDQRILELMERIEIQKESMQEFHEQLEKIQQDKIVLQTLIAELDKCTVNNCPVELKFKVEKILKESLSDDIKNTNLTKSDSVEDGDDEMDHKFENNVSHLNQTDCNKLKELNTSLDPKEMEDLLVKLKDELKELQDSTEDNDNKTEDLESLREQILHWTLRIEEESNVNRTQRESTGTLVHEPLDNSHYVKREPELTDLKNKLHAAQNDLMEKTTTIAKMSEEVESLLVSSALVNSKINLLENDLIEEREASLLYKKEIDRLKSDLSVTQQMLSCSSMEELNLKTKLDDLIDELNSRPETSAHEEIKQKCCHLERMITKLKDGENIPDLDKEKIIELEEELVVMKERYAECNIEKVQLNKSLEALQKRYNAQANQKQNIMFLYIAPFVLLLLYLFVSSLFS